MKKTVPIVLCFTIGCLLMVRYFVPALEPAEAYARRFLIVLGSTAGLLGILSFAVHHGMKAHRKAPKWPLSVVALLAFLAMATTGFVGKGIEFGTPAYKLFLYAYAPMDATMFALLAFYISSAAFRAFRARNLEATLLLGAAVIVMLGRVPIGEEYIPFVADVSTWILDFPNTAAKRAIMIGVGFGMASTSLKLMLGIERAYLGRD